MTQGHVDRRLPKAEAADTIAHHRTESILHISIKLGYTKNTFNRIKTDRESLRDRLLNNKEKYGTVDRGSTRREQEIQVPVGPRRRYMVEKFMLDLILFNKRLTLIAFLSSLLAGTFGSVFQAENVETGMSCADTVCVRAALASIIS